MKRLAPRTHGVLDYVVVAAFGLAPSLFGLTGIATLIAYGLAAAHFVLTLLTRFRRRTGEVLSVRLHALIEFLVAAALIAVPWLVHGAFGDRDRAFFTVAGTLILVFWALTRYTDADRIFVRGG